MFICILLVVLIHSKLNFMLQCASAVDNLAAFYFNNITMGEAPTSPAAINLARRIADGPNLFPEVSGVFYNFILCNSKIKRN